MKVVARIKSWLEGPRYIEASRQIPDHGEIEALKTDILLKAAANKGYFVPPNFELDEGILGASKLHHALRELQAEGALIKVPYEGWGDRWVIP